ncbi:MAG: ClpX C4-type zinc finger protein [Vicinamibacterales bacterium]
MPLQPDLLERVRGAAKALEEAERQAKLARADYHVAIRRLHLAGGSLREIARELSMSHQRAQQIVNEAGGSWWRRMWRTRRIQKDAICTWCGRPPSEVQALVAGPAVYMCDACIAAAERAVAGTDPEPAFEVERTRSPRRCLFCSKRADFDLALALAPAGDICEQCLGVCRAILEGRHPPAA